MDKKTYDTIQFWVRCIGALTCVIMAYYWITGKWMNSHLDGEIMILVTMVSAVVAGSIYDEMLRGMVKET